MNGHQSKKNFIIIVDAIKVNTLNDIQVGKIKLRVTKTE